MRFLQLRMSFYLNQLFSCYYRFLWLNMQRSNPCLNQNLIFFLFDFCLYTSLWYKRGKSNLFSIIAMQIIAPSTPQTLSEGWYSSHQERDRGQVNVLICAAPCCPSGHGPVPLFLRHTQVSNALFCTYIFTLLLTSETSIIESTFCLRIVF